MFLLALLVNKQRLVSRRNGSNQIDAEVGMRIRISASMWFVSWQKSASIEDPSGGEIETLVANGKWKTEREETTCALMMLWASQRLDCVKVPSATLFLGEEKGEECAAIEATNYGVRSTIMMSEDSLLPRL